MNNLIIDCSAGMTAIIDTEKGVFSKIDLNQKKHTDELLFSVDELLNEAKISVDEIDNFCVCVGPGSFTGIRVAVSIVKGLAVVSGARIFVLSNFDIYDICGSKNYKLILDGFSEYVYTKTVSDKGVFEKCESISDVIEELKNVDCDVFVQTEKTQNILKNAEITSQIAQNVINFAFNSKIQNNEFIEINEISPIYLRASQAEIERNNRLAGKK